jgi:hypothetical protein
MTPQGYAYNPPPGWKVPPGDWLPPEGWTPDPTWPPAPPGWVFWIPVAPPNVPASESTLPSPPDDGAVPVLAVGAGARQPAADGDSERQQLRERVAELEAEVTRLLSERDAPAQEAGIVDLDDERVLQEVGIYRYHHPLHGQTRRGCARL